MLRAKFLAIFLSSLLILGITSTAAAGNPPHRLHEGDLILLSMPCYFCGLIEKTTQSQFSHVGIIHKSQSGKLSVIMAVPPKVMEVDLEFLVSHARQAPSFFRFKQKHLRETSKIAARFAPYYLGTPYDDKFELGEDKLYCSELIYFLFMRAAGREVFHLQPMRFSPYENEWQLYFQGTPIPEGKLGVSPQDIANSSFLKLVP